MAQQKKMVEEITSMDEDFTKWYTDIVKKAELIDYSSVRGCYILRPFTAMPSGKTSRRFWTGASKKLGHENVSMPMFIPESLPAEGKGSRCRLCAGGGVGHSRRLGAFAGAAVRPADFGDAVL